MARLWVALLVASVACASGPRGLGAEAERLRRALERALAEAPPPDPSELLVHLAFGPGADLDLYVTDALQETVYFANTPSGSGGRLLEDLHCGSPGGTDRVETVRFAAPPAGRYRVSVDHPRSCGRGREAGFAVAAQHGGAVRFQTGSVAQRVFLPIVLELDVQDPRAKDAAAAHRYRLPD